MLCHYRSTNASMNIVHMDHNIITAKAILKSDIEKWSSVIFFLFIALLNLPLFSHFADQGRWTAKDQGHLHV